MALVKADIEYLSGLVQELYSVAPSGGSLHHMLEDLNLEDHWFEDPLWHMPGISDRQRKVEQRIWQCLSGMTFVERMHYIRSHRRG